MTLTPPSSHGGGGGPPTAPYTPTPGEDLSVLVDSSGDRIIEYDDDGGTLELNSPDRDQQVYVGNIGISLPHDPAGLIGFYGATPITRPVVPLTTPAVQDVIDALVALGLITQSD